MIATWLNVAHVKPKEEEFLPKYILHFHQFSIKMMKSNILSFSRIASWPSSYYSLRMSEGQESNFLSFIGGM